MNFRWVMRRLHRWGGSRHKLRGGYMHSLLGDRLLERDLWFPSRESLARAWLVGLPVSIVPFLPFQTVIACSIGFFARANLPVCFAVQFLSNPATAFIQLPMCYFVGRFLMGAPMNATLMQLETHPIHALASAQTVQALYLGAFVLGPLLGVLGYLLTHLLWRAKPRAAKASP